MLVYGNYPSVLFYFCSPVNGAQSCCGIIQRSYTQLGQSKIDLKWITAADLLSTDFYSDFPIKAFCIRSVLSIKIRQMYKLGMESHLPGHLLATLIDARFFFWCSSLVPYPTSLSKSLMMGLSLLSWRNSRSTNIMVGNSLFTSSLNFPWLLLNYSFSNISLTSILFHYVMLIPI